MRTAVDALVQSPQGVVLQSPHEVKQGNGGREYVDCRESIYYAVPLSYPGTPGWGSNAFEHVEWRWFDWTQLGANGAESFYNTYNVHFGAFPQPLDWTQGLWSGNYDPSNGIAPPRESQGTAGPGWPQGSGPSSLNPYGTWAGAAWGYSASGWSIWQGGVIMTMGQTRYLGDRDKVYYWIGRYRTTLDENGIWTHSRYDFIRDGWLTVVNGEAILQAPYTTGLPFPLEALNYPSAPDPWAVKQAVTCDIYFGVVDIGTGDWLKESGVTFGVWT